VGDRRHLVAREQLRKKPHHHLAVLEHVRHAAGHAQVVLQHVVLPLAGADDVDAGDVRVDAAGHIDAVHLGAVLLVLEHLVGRHLSGPDDVLAVVDVVQEHVQRAHALTQPCLELLPFVGRDHARDHIEGNQPLRAGRFAVNGERDANATKHEVGLGTLVGHRLRALAMQPRLVAAIVRPGCPRGREHLVEGGGHREQLIEESGQTQRV